MDFSTIPTVADFQRAGVVSTTNTEVVRQTLYDFMLYPLGGLPLFSFFANPLGQGFATAPGSAVGQAKTSADTNGELAGQLPQGKAFMIETIEVCFFPGLSAAANTYVPALPSVFNTAEGASLDAQANDVELLRQSGVLEINISSKNYLRETPLGRFPPKTSLSLSASIFSNSATVGEVSAVTASWSGRPYILDPVITLQSGVNFDVSFKFPGPVALPSGFNGRIGVMLDGYLLRAQQ